MMFDISVFSPRLRGRRGWSLVVGIVMSFLVTANRGLPTAYAQESDQTINDFSLSGYGDKGKKSWDLSGKTADIFVEVIKLNKVVGNMYGKDENIKLTADKGDFNKTDGKIHLEKNVVITTSSGTKLTTDSMDWDRKEQLVTTEDIVKIRKENLFTVAKGARGKPDLKKVSLQKDVLVDIIPVSDDKSKPPDPGDKTTITCDGPLEIDYEKNIASFSNNVRVDRSDSVIYSDKMDVYFFSGSDEAVTQKDKKKGRESPGLMGNKIDKIICRGNVKVERGQNLSFSDEAIYNAKDKKLTLSGRPKLVIYSTEEFSGASFGN